MGGWVRAGGGWAAGRSLFPARGHAPRAGPSLHSKAKAAKRAKPSKPSEARRLVLFHLSSVGGDARVGVLGEPRFPLRVVLGDPRKDGVAAEAERQHAAHRREEKAPLAHHPATSGERATERVSQDKTGNERDEMRGCDSERSERG